MYTLAILTTLTTLSTTSVAAVLPRQIVAPQPAANPAGKFDITNFHVSGPPGGTTDTLYTLSLTDAAVSPSNVSTVCTTTTQSEPAAFANLSCDDPSVRWSLAGNGTGFLLEVKHNWGIQVRHAIVTAYDNVTDTAGAYFPCSDLRYGPQGPGGEAEPCLVAPSIFSLEYSRYIL